MTMHAQMPPRRPPTLDERVDVHDEQISALVDATDETRRERSADNERLFGELTGMHATMREIKTSVGSVDQRVGRQEVLLQAELDKERSRTDGEIVNLARKYKDLRQKMEDHKREVLARIDQVDGKADASGQQSRDTLTSVQKAAVQMDLETKLALERQEAANRERILQERIQREQAEAAAAKQSAADAKAALAKLEDHNTGWKTWFVRGLVVCVLIAGAGIIGWLASRALPPPPAAATHAIGVPALDR